MMSGPSKLANDMEDEVLEKCRIKIKMLAHTKAMVGLLSGSTRRRGRMKARLRSVGEKCLVAPVMEFNRVCKQIVSEG